MSQRDRIRRLFSRLPRMMLKDQWKLREALERLSSSTSGPEAEKDLSIILSGLEKKAAFSISRRALRKARLPRPSVPQNLPIASRQHEIIGAIKSNQVVIIAGETGSGKSTQIPKMCLLAGRGVAGLIGCTQPRRIAAATISARIAEELGEEVGAAVGMKVRFNQKIGPNAYIKIMTDGILLAETQGDPLLLEYDTLILDEVHERNLNIDFIIGILRKLLPRRPELKVIITSATMDTARISAAFWEAPVIEVSGRTYPVEIDYMPIDPHLEEAGETTYVDMAVKAVERIRHGMAPGDILIFMPTEQDIHETCKRLEGKRFSGLSIYPLYARLPASRQALIFSERAAKIVVATNVAETSITIPNIRYVIDTGLARISQYLPDSRITSLPVTEISRSSADQRAGRCGRVRAGLCIRLYSREDYESRPMFTPPEILRANLAEVILRMISLGLGDVASFPFLDRPSAKSIADGFKVLVELGAVEKKEDAYALTETGRRMAMLPLDPRISRMLLEAVKEGCVKEVSIIAAALSIQDPRERPSDKPEEADLVHMPYRHPESDFLTLLSLWNRYNKALSELLTQNQMRRFCREHFLSFTRMREWIFIHEQITGILKEQRIQCDSGAAQKKDSEAYAAIHRSILSGLLSNIALRKERTFYQAARGKEVMLFPGSVLFSRPPEWIMAAAIVKTTKVFARCAARIEPNWIEPLASALCRRSYSEPHWDSKRGEVRAYERVTLYGLPIVERRPVSFGPIDPEVSRRIFIRSALIEGATQERPPFLMHNLELIERVRSMEEKLRKRGIMADEGMLEQFYADRLPLIWDMRSLKSLIKQRGNDSFLRMTEQDIVTSMPDESEVSKFPDKLKVGLAELACKYSFSPGKEHDGITVSIPAPLAPGLKAESLENKIPGFLKEKVGYLLRSLPKEYRKRLSPLSEKADIIAAEICEREGSILVETARVIHSRFRVEIPPKVWEDLPIPAHLKLRYVLTDPMGKELIASRDPLILNKGDLISESLEQMEQWKKAKARWEKEKLTDWDLGELPEEIKVAPNLPAYPGLKVEGGHVCLRLFNSPVEAFESHKSGLEALLRHRLSKEIKALRRYLSIPPSVPRALSFLGGKDKLIDGIIEAVLASASDGRARSPEAFRSCEALLKERLYPHAAELLAALKEILLAMEGCIATVLDLEAELRRSAFYSSLSEIIRKDLKDLVPSDFLTRYSNERLRDLTRYIKCLEIRAQRAINNPAKDKERDAELRKALELFEKLKNPPNIPFSKDRYKAVEDFRWMIEEFKISLFAQELKTKYPVSLKRLAHKASEIMLMP
jgi:ATP-dependent helicase HrpA